jgi:uncharacterized membrane protein
MEIVKAAAQYVAYFIEGAAVLVISVGAVQPVVAYIARHILRKSSPDGILESRIKLGHSLSMGLGFLVGADIILTAVSPTWDEIGHLAAIVGIRIILNYFLMRDLKLLASEKPT